MESTDSFTVYCVQKESELRFSVGEEVSVSVELLTGFAEIFGSELVRNKVYTFPPYSSVSLFSWKGCSVKMRGKAQKVQAFTNTLMMAYVRIHSCLEAIRAIASIKSMMGPIILVVGPLQSGKTSLCRLLSNYAARVGRRPLYVDLNVSNSSFSIPGAISVLSMESQLEITEGFEPHGTLSVFNFGYLDPTNHVKLYYHLVKKLGQTLHTRLENSRPNIRNSGMIIDTCDYVRGRGYNANNLAAYAFQVDVVFVVADENVYTQLRIGLPNHMQVMFVPKFEGVIKRNAEICKDIQSNRVWEYFYGSNNARLEPYEFDVKFSNVEIYTVRKRSDSELSDPFKIALDDVAPVPVPIGPELVNQVMGLSFADAADENLIFTSVKGFVCIFGVDMVQRVLTVLSPFPAPLSSKILIMGDIKLRRLSNEPLALKHIDYSLDDEIF